MEYSMCFPANWLSYNPTSAWNKETPVPEMWLAGFFHPHKVAVSLDELTVAGDRCLFGDP